MLSHQSCINNYASKATRLIARIEQIKQQTSETLQAVLKTHDRAENMRKKNQELDVYRQKLKQLSQDMHYSNYLGGMFEQATEKQDCQVAIKDDAKEPIKPPKIQVPNMSWVINSLQQIQEENFYQAREKLTKEREILTSLESTLGKYQEKLRQVEVKLMKGYEQTRSKRRYL